MENIKIKGLEDGDLSKYSLQKLAQIEGGKTTGLLHKETNHLSNIGKISATKQWEENRKGELIKSKRGGESARDNKKGCHSLSKDELSNAGKKGFANGLGKLTKEEISNIGKKAGRANRDKNSKLKPEDVLFMRKNFIPRHPEFGVVAFSKKYQLSEGRIRAAIQGKSFKDIV